MSRAPASTTVENYLKEIFLARGPESDLVSMGTVARALKVSPGTATTMAKSLAAKGYVGYRPRSGVKLTAKGERLALSIVRRHRLVELFLERTLKLDWAEIHAEAERLEHALSDRVLDAIDAYLGHPETDPHGDPIPRADGAIDVRHRANLADCAVGLKLRIARITDQAPAFLHFVESHGLRPGAQVMVERRELEADSVLLRVGPHRSPLAMGTHAAGKIQVE